MHALPWFHLHSTYRLVNSWTSVSALDACTIDTKTPQKNQLSLLLVDTAAKRLNCESRQSFTLRSSSTTATAASAERSAMLLKSSGGRTTERHVLSASALGMRSNAVISSETQELV